MFDKGSRLVRKWKKLPPPKIVIGSMEVTDSTFRQLDSIRVLCRTMQEVLRSEIVEAKLAPDSAESRELHRILASYEDKIVEIKQLEERFRRS